MRRTRSSRLVVLHLAVLMGSLSLVAPCFGQSQPVVAHAISNSGCPVLVTAKYVPGASIRLVNPAESSPSRYPLHLSFGVLVKDPRYGLNFPSPPIEVREAQVSVHGISEKGGVIPANAADSRSSLMEKSFTVNVTRNAAGVYTSTIWLTGFGGVSDVRVDSITYTDGKTWKASEQETCHAATGAMLRSSN